jgi:uncharacterized membrane protein YphA (DoxX/SURF4 family)
MIETGCPLQRLFSTFPNSWPGLGLLLLRLNLSAALICFGTAQNAENLIAAAGGLLLLAGLWTPAAAVLTALGQAFIAFSFSSPRREDFWIHIFLAVLALSLAMLGPGAWSIDARLFGRKRFDIGPPGGRKISH